MDKASPTDAEMAERSYGALGDAFSIAIALIASDLTILWTNPAADRVLCWPERGLVGRNAVECLHPDDLDHFATVAGEMAQLAEESEEPPRPSTPVELPVRVLRADGGWNQMNVTGRVLDNNGMMLAVLRPAAERHAFDAVLDGLGGGARLDHLLETIMGLVGAQFGVEQAWAFHDAGGEPAELALDDSPAPFSAAAVLAETRSLEFVPKVLVLDDYWIAPITSAEPERVFGALVVPGSRQGGPSPWDELIAHRTANLATVAFTRDRYDRLLHEAATTDHLTGVMNRREFEQTLHDRQAATLPLTLFFLDLNEFKLVNDELGHLAGDAVLMAVARRVRSMVRGGDFVGRLGGDEFVVCCPGLSAHEVEPTRRRIASIVEEPISLEGRSVSVTASVGMAHAEDEAEVQSLMRRSDSDMFDRKRDRAQMLRSVHAHPAGTGHPRALRPT